MLSPKRICCLLKNILTGETFFGRWNFKNTTPALAYLLQDTSVCYVNLLNWPGMCDFAKNRDTCT